VEGDISISVFNTHTVDFVNKSIELHSSRGVYRFTEINNDIYNQFASGNILLLTASISTAETFLREMNNYYVIPSPKYDETQKEYRTCVWNECAIIGIAAGSDDIAASAALLEAMCAESYNTVSSIYYDEALKYKYTRDDDAARMIDILRKTVYSDFAFVWGNSLGPVANFMQIEKSSNVASSIRTDEIVLKKSLENLLEKLEKIKN